MFAATKHAEALISHPPEIFLDILNRKNKKKRPINFK